MVVPAHAYLADSFLATVGNATAAIGQVMRRAFACGCLPMDLSCIRATTGSVSAAISAEAAFEHATIEAIAHRLDGRHSEANEAARKARWLYRDWKELEDPAP